MMEGVQGRGLRNIFQNSTIFEVMSIARTLDAEISHLYSADSKLAEIQCLYDQVSRMKTLLESMMPDAGSEERGAEQHFEHIERTASIESPLTKKEIELLDLMSRGLSYKESASMLGCRVSTVQTHIKRIYKKLGVHSRAEAVFEYQSALQT